MELRDYLLPDYEPLEVTEEDRKSLFRDAHTQAVQTILKVCIGKMIEARSAVVDSPVTLTESEAESRIGAYKAYRWLAQYITEPFEKEETTNE